MAGPRDGKAWRLSPFTCLTPPFRTERIAVTDEEHRHLVVARAESGEHMEVFDGKGHVWNCVVTHVAKRQTSLRVQDERTFPAPKVDLILGQALIRHPPLKWHWKKPLRLESHASFRSLRLARTSRAWNATSDGSALLSRRQNNPKHFHLPMLESPRAFDRSVNYSRNFSDYVCRARRWSAKVGSRRLARSIPGRS